MCVQGRGRKSVWSVSPSPNLIGLLLGVDILPCVPKCHPTEQPHNLLGTPSNYTEKGQ